LHFVIVLDPRFRRNYNCTARETMTSAAVVASLLLSTAGVSTAFRMPGTAARNGRTVPTMALFDGGNSGKSELGKPVLTKWEFDNYDKKSPVLNTNRVGGPWVEQRARPRRNRKSANMRGLVRENIVTPKDFIYPLFIHEADYQEEISSMPGCFRHSMKSMMLEVEEAMKYGVGSFVLFPKVPDNLKTNFAEEAYNPTGIVPRAVQVNCVLVLFPPFAFVVTTGCPFPPPADDQVQVPGGHRVHGRGAGPVLLHGPRRRRRGRQDPQRRDDPAAAGTNPPKGPLSLTKDN